MQKHLTGLLVILFISAFSTLKSQPFSQKMANTVMTIWKDSMQQGRPARWTYEQGVILKGIEAIWKNTGDKKYFDYIQQSVDLFVQPDGTIRTYKQEDYNIDNVLPGRSLLTLYKVTNRDKYLKAVKHLREQLIRHPRTNEGGFWHKKIYPYQMWLDGLYMGQPFYTEYAVTFNEDTIFNDVAKQFILMEKHSRDDKTGLLVHGYDESREQRWANKNTGRSEHVWGRAMGWYGMALVDVLEWFPEDHPKREAILSIFHRYAAAVEKHQVKNSGLWWNIMDQPGREKNYLEASAACMFVYALAKGSRLGLLPAKYSSVAQKGFDGITKRFIKEENGLTMLHGTVSVSGLGGNPYRDGSYAYYMSERVVVNDPKGVGAFMLAATEVEMIPTLKTGRGKTVLLDNYFNYEKMKAPTGDTIDYHYIWSEMDNNGFSLLGHVFNKFGVQTKTLKEAPSAAKLKGSDIYIIVDPDSKKESPSPNYIGESHIDEINSWVRNGGVLLLFGNDSANVETAHFSRLLNRFGVKLKSGSRNMVVRDQYEMGTIDIPANHSIFKTAKKLYLKEISTFEVSPPAKAVVSDKGDVIMAVADVGKGKVFVVGDPWLYNEYTDGRKLPATFQNYRAAEDLVRWAIRQSR